MDDAEIFQIIANVGFAGLIAILLLRYVTSELSKKLDQLTQAINDLRQVIIEYLIGDKRESKR